MNTETIALVGTSFLAYLVGSIPFGLLMGWMKGVDLREVGSKNIGATNAGRILGKKIFLLVMILDMLKGLLPTLLSPWILQSLGQKAFPWVSLMAGMCAILGHVFPIYLKFKGGKGVATSAGVFLGLCPQAMGIAFAVWLLILLTSQYMSMASIAGAVVLLLSHLCLDPLAATENLPITIALGISSFLIIFRHRSNMIRLWKGEESRFSLIGKKEKPREDEVVQ